MISICMAGACGRMGTRILQIAAKDPELSISGAFDLPTLAGREIALEDHAGRTLCLRVTADAASALSQADVLIDFTAAEACAAHVKIAAGMGKPAVVGTTGLPADQLAAMQFTASNVAVVHAPNMSVGVNLLFKLTRDVAATLGLEYNVEIMEIHHNQKKDSPSGTAVRLAEQAASGLGLRYPDDAVFGREGLVGSRPERQIGVHAIRGGDVIGEHTVAFIGKGERLELTHKAHNRDNFALGALLAAKFAVQAPPGWYDMQDVLRLR